MKTIKLTRGQYTMVDNKDFEWLNKFKWFACKWTNSFCAAGWHENKSRYMHRLILGLKSDDKRQADHINHNTLDNRRCNLRITTASQNHMNEKPHKKFSSKYKGVCRCKQYKKWVVRITKECKQIYLGLFDNETDAALMYNQIAEQLFGEYCFLNKIDLGKKVIGPIAKWI